MVYWHHGLCKETFILTSIWESLLCGLWVVQRTTATDHGGFNKLWKNWHGCTRTGLVGWSTCKAMLNKPTTRSSICYTAAATRLLLQSPSERPSALRRHLWGVPNQSSRLSNTQLNPTRLHRKTDRRDSSSPVSQRRTSDERQRRYFALVAVKQPKRFSFSTHHGFI